VTGREWEEGREGEKKKRIGTEKKVERGRKRERILTSLSRKLNMNPTPFILSNAAADPPQLLLNG